MSEEATNLRSWRNGLKFSLEQVCDLLERQGLKRPSEAKLSRIEREQDIPLDMLPAFEAVTGIPAKDLRPDVAKLFAEQGQ